MAIHHLNYSQKLHAPVEEAWAFFSSPANLEKITPPNLGFVVRSALPKEVYAGLMIEYSVRPLAGFPVTWLTEITHVRAPFYFSDEQRRGPYRIWHHEHFFEPQPDGTVLMRDQIHYVLPFSPFSDVLNPWLVRPRLEEIFNFRRKIIAERFPGS